MPAGKQQGDAFALRAPAHSRLREQAENKGRGTVKHGISGDTLYRAKPQHVLSGRLRHQGSDPDTPLPDADAVGAGQVPEPFAETGARSLAASNAGGVGAVFQRAGQNDFRPRQAGFRQ